LELCLKSVEAAVSTLDAEIIVVDNNSKDGSCKMVKALFPKVIRIENKDNPGFSIGNNQGVKIAKGEYICILNPDTVVAEDTFTKLLDFAETIPDLGIIGCKLIDGKGDFLPESKRNIPTPNVAIKKVLGFTNAYYANHLKEDQVGKVSTLVGAFMLLKKGVYDEVGGFDEDYFMYGEDVDLSYKILKKGYQNYYNPSTTVIHYKGESTLKDKAYAKRFNSAMQIFFKKHFKPNVIFNTLIFFGVKILILFYRDEKAGANPVDKYVLVSHKESGQLQSALQSELKLQLKVDTFEAQTEYILDNNALSFKSIINLMSHPNKKKTTTFKILPKNSTFILGSNSSKSRGSVIAFNQN
jgi:GT2 family glycosyltransferase